MITPAMLGSGALVSSLDKLGVRVATLERVYFSSNFVDCNGCSVRKVA